MTLFTDPYANISSHFWRPADPMVFLVVLWIGLRSPAPSNSQLLWSPPQTHKKAHTNTHRFDRMLLPFHPWFAFLTQFCAPVLLWLTGKGPLSGWWGLWWAWKKYPPTAVIILCSFEYAEEHNIIHPTSRLYQKGFSRQSILRTRHSQSSTGKKLLDLQYGLL